MAAMCPRELAGWLGSKAGNGVYQRIINEIPAHDTFVEGFAGGAAVFCAMRTAARTFLVDRDPGVMAAWRSTLADRGDVSCIEGGFLDVVDRYSLGRAIGSGNTVVYLDPPYLGETRGGCGYRFDMREAWQHRELLRWALEARCRVLISGYWSSLYAEMLEGWRCIDWQVGSHGGARREWLWMNFPPASTLHDARFAGDTFRDRERIKRRARSLESQLQAMSPIEKQHCWEYLLACYGDGGSERRSTRT